MDVIERVPGAGLMENEWSVSMVWPEMLRVACLRKEPLFHRVVET